jgi:hypothetical protein
MRASLVFLLGFAAGAIGVVRWIERQRLGLQTQDVSVMVDSGVAYLRGSSDAVTADTLRATASRLPGVREVRDELARPN